MKTKSFILLLLLFVTVINLISCNQEPNTTHEKGLQRLPQAADQFAKEQRIAIIVGIDQYHPNSGFRNLQYAVDDAKALAEQFEKQRYTTKLILDSDAKEHFILQAISEAGKLLEKQQGTLVFVFTGHGFADNDRNNYLAVDGSTSFNLAKSGLSLNSVKQAIRNTGARRSMLFIDACRDNPTKGKSVSNPSFTDLAESEGLNILYSTAQNDVSYENPTLKHGVFSYFLLQGLQGDAAQQDGLILFNDLANYVAKEVKNWSFKHLPKVQKPFRAGESSGRFLVGALNKEIIELLLAKPQQEVVMENKEKLKPPAIIEKIQLAESKKRPTGSNDKELQWAITNRETKDSEKAIKIIKKLSDQGNVIANARMASFYFHGHLKFIQKNLELAKKFGKKAITGGLKKQANEDNNALAQYALGLLYDRGLGVEKNRQQAIKWYQKSAEQGESNGQYSLGLGYKLGEGIEQNYKLATLWYHKAAMQNNAYGQTSMGSMYMLGRGVEKDYKQAIEWYRKAAEQGGLLGQVAMGNVYESGKGVEKDYKQAVKWYRKAAEQDYSTAQSHLGYMYREGKGVEKDYKQAVKWYREAAEQNDPNAQNNLGFMYEKGDGVEKDYKQAINWYQKAAEQGLSDGQVSLGTMHYNGVGVKRNRRKAVKLYRKAAEQGNAYGQRNLGLMYELHQGGLQLDYPKALSWYKKAKENGYVGIDEDIRRVLKK